MNPADFESTLHRNGFSEVQTKALPADCFNAEHDHPFEIRALVTAGEITLTVDGQSRVYREGDVFTMPAGCRHEESVGPAGVSYLVGRRYTA